jgi:hypothetical protein
MNGVYEKLTFLLLLLYVTIRVLHMWLFLKGRSPLSRLHLYDPQIGQSLCKKYLCYEHSGTFIHFELSDLCSLSVGSCRTADTQKQGQLVKREKITRQTTYTSIIYRPQRKHVHKHGKKTSLD